MLSQLVCFLLIVASILAACDSNSSEFDSEADTPVKAAKSVKYDRSALFIEPSKKVWAFKPLKDTFSKLSALDLSWLNTPITKPSQRVVLANDKNSFALLNGEAIRFWAINVFGNNLSAEQIDNQIRFLVKRGVNMVRLHVSINAKGKNSNINDIDQAVLEQTFLYVSALKKYGVYLTYSPFYPNAVTRNGRPNSIGKNWPVPKNKSADNLNNLLFFDPDLQAAYKNWLKILFTKINPHTGLALKDDPVFAVLQLQNEDSLLFWTFNGLRGEDLDTLRKQFGQWLISKYGSLKVVQEKWQGEKAKDSSVDDDWQHGLVSFSGIWHLTRSEESILKSQRLKDQAEFLTFTMKNFNYEISNFVRNEIGAKVLINAGNWRTASAERLDDLERYSYSDTDIMAANRYVGALHEGDNAGWAIANKQKYKDASVLLDPTALPISIKQPAGYPFIISESGWITPISFQAEGPFLVSAFQSLNGVDAFYWFAAGEEQWRQPSSANGYFPSIGKWVTQTPMILGQFPAAAFSYRKGLIKPGKTLFSEARSPDQLFNRAKPLIVEGHGFDPNRDKTWREQADIENGVAFLGGRVEVKFEAGSSQIDHKALAGISKHGWINSSNHQIAWNPEQGIATINAPAVQGSCGFFDGKPIVTSDVSIVVNNPYACVWVVALDELPISKSQKLLVQMGTRQFSTGWKTKEVSWESKGRQMSGHELVEIGGAPWQIEKLKAVLTLKNSLVDLATVLDANGMPAKEIPFVRNQQTLTISLPEDALYLILEPTKPN